MTDFLNNWDNNDNDAFYEKVPVDILKDFSLKGGLNQVADLEILKNEIDKANCILEVGAGFGRVIDGLLSNEACNATIHAVEKSARFCQLLKTKYANNPRVHTYCTDIKDFTPEQHFDLILWLWSGVSDFAAKEQFLIIKRLYSFLAPHGSLIIDTLISERKPNNNVCDSVQTYIKDNEYLIDANGHLVRGMMPKNDDIMSFAQIMLGCMNPRHIEYKTDSNIKRNMFFLKK